MKNQFLVSVIIVNFNGKNYLEKCLESLMKINYEKYEIILVDNNSSDKSIEFVKNSFPSVIIIKLNKNYGFAEPNNIGAKNAKGDLLLFLNNDTVVRPNFINEMVEVLKKDSKIAICQSLLMKPNGEVDSSGDFIDTLGRSYTSRNKETNVKKILSAKGASMMVKTDSFWDLGGFDKKFFASFEDVELGWNAWIRGYEVVLAPKSIVYHEGGQTVSGFSSEIKFHGVKNNLILHLVNFETFFAIKSLIKFSWVMFIKKCFGISIVKEHDEKTSLPSFRTILRGLAWVLRNFRYISEKRKVINSRRVRSTKDLIDMGLITKI